MTISGIHHITAIASDPQKNLDFYTEKLGLRLVKLTVNFDDPGAYHFYFGDKTGKPGSILTFFPWPNATRGRRGTGQATAIAFDVPNLEGWAARLPNGRIEPRFGTDALVFQDPDGLELELIPTGGTGNGISGFHGVTLSEAGFETTAKLLTETFGYKLAASESNRFRYVSTERGAVELLCQPDSRRGAMGAGTVHHVAFRTESDESQRAWRKQLAGAGLNVTPVLDRQYFHSIYFREPGGVLFEIATDPPGFLIDETIGDLGTHLKLPPWLEPAREEIEGILPKIQLPEYAG